MGFIYTYSDSPTNTILTNVAYNGSGSTIAVLEDTVKIIGAYAFQAVSSNVTKVTIPVGVTKIESYAFYGCANLIEAVIPSTVTQTGTNIFEGCGFTHYNWPTHLTTINDNTFAWCVELLEVTIPDGVTYIGNAVFLLCRKLIKADIPSTVTSIGNSLFQVCNFTQYNWPSQFTTIPNNTFNGCPNLTSFTIPPSVTHIGTGAFAWSGLTNISIPATVISTGHSLFQQSKIETFIWPSHLTTMPLLVFASCAQLTNITISNGVTTIDDYAFVACENLLEVIIPNSVTSIGASVFSRCTFNTFTWPSTIPTINDNMFYLCLQLSSIIIPDTVTAIGNNVFYGCALLSSITFQSVQPNLPVLSSNTFQNTPAINATNYQTISDMINQGYPITLSNTYGFDASAIIASLDLYPFKYTYSDSPANTNLVSVTYNIASYTTIAILESTVKIIGDNAFHLVGSNLTEVIIPDSVTKIGIGAFQGCSNLTNIIFQRSISDGLTILGSNCFLNTSLNSQFILEIYRSGYTRYDLITSGLPTNIVDQVISNENGGVITISLYYYFNN